MTTRSSLICRVESGHSRSVTTDADMALVVETRHRVVGLRRKPGAGDAPAGERLEHREAAAAQEAMHAAR